MAAKAGKNGEARADKLNYEEIRRKVVEENRKRLEELGLLEAASLMKKSPPKATTPRKTVRRSEETETEIRRSPRVAKNSPVRYATSAVENLPRRRVRREGTRQVLKRGFISPAARTEAASKAGCVTTEYPSFVKMMLKSHVSGGFWLGLPSAFCAAHFSKDDLVILEDENGYQWETVYLHHKHGLSGGWRGFSLDHDLEDGDALVFELVTPTRFKVHITKATGGETHGPGAELTSPKKYRYVLKENKENEHVNSALHKSLKEEQSQAEGSPSPKRVKSLKSSRKRKLELSEPSTRGKQTEDELPTQESFSSEGIIDVEIAADDESSEDVGLTESRQAKPGHRSQKPRTPATNRLLKSTSQESKYRKYGTQRGRETKPQRNHNDTHKREAYHSKAIPAMDEDKGVDLKKARFAKVMVQRTDIKAATKTTHNMPSGAKSTAVAFCSIAESSLTRRPHGSTSKRSFFCPGTSGKIAQ